MDSFSVSENKGKKVLNVYGSMQSSVEKKTCLCFTCCTIRKLTKNEATEPHFLLKIKHFEVLFI